MPRLVLDASVVVARFLPGEDHAGAAGAVMDEVARGGAEVPGIWRTEVGNALLVAERRRRIAPGDAERFLSALGTMPVAVDGQTGERAWTDTLSLARRHGLTLYDAAYLELALRRRADLATFDLALRRAASAEGISLAP